MLLVQKSDDDKIPYKPFPDGEQIKKLYSDDFIKAITENSEIEFYPENTGFVFILPANNCTVLLGITDEEYSELKGSGIVRNVEAYFDIGPVDFYEDGVTGIYQNVLSLQSKVGTDTWSPSHTEKYVRIKFEDKTNTTVITSLSSGPLIGGGTTSNGEEICAYPNFYIKTSNEIHEHGPDLDEEGNPLVITIKKSLFY
jgi:hypothetical protein